VADGAASAVAAGDGVLERVLQRDRWIVASALALLAALCWLYLLAMADAMRAMTGEGGSGAYMWLMPMGAWSAAEFALALAMWIVMMIGMMVPSAAPRSSCTRSSAAASSSGVLFCPRSVCSPSATSRSGPGSASRRPACSSASPKRA